MARQSESPYCLIQDRSRAPILAFVVKRSDVAHRTLFLSGMADQRRRVCLMLDVRLPGMSGLDFQSQLTQLGVFILVTSHGDIPMSVRAKKVGAVDFLPKPFRDQESTRRGDDGDRARSQVPRGFTSSRLISAPACFSCRVACPVSITIRAPGRRQLSLAEILQGNLDSFIVHLLEVFTILIATLRAA